MAARAKPTTKTTNGSVATLTRLVEASTEIEIEAISPAIPHKWSEKSKRMMPGHPDKPQIAETKGARKPQEEAEDCVHRLPDGRPGIPATAIKAAMVGACRLFDGLTMTEAKILFWVKGEGPEQLIPFEFEGEPILREDTPRNANGGADLRYRYQFNAWRATIKLHYLQGKISPDSLVSLLDAGGRGGWGDWRPSSPKSATGMYGMWRVVTEDPPEASK